MFAGPITIYAYLPYNTVQLRRHPRPWRPLRRSLFLWSVLCPCSLSPSIPSDLTESAKPRHPLTFYKYYIRWKTRFFWITLPRILLGWNNLCLRYHFERLRDSVCARNHGTFPNDIWDISYTATYVARWGKFVGLIVLHPVGAVFTQVASPYR